MCQIIHLPLAPSYSFTFTLAAWRIKTQGWNASPLWMAILYQIPHRSIFIRKKRGSEQISVWINSNLSPKLYKTWHKIDARNGFLLGRGGSHLCDYSGTCNELVSIFCPTLSGISSIVCRELTFRLFTGSKGQACIWSNIGKIMCARATKAGKSLCIRTGRTIDDNGLHKHYLKLFTWHWRDGRRLTIAAKPAYCAEVKRSLMNRKPYLRELTVTIQQPYCVLATNPVGLYIRRNDEKVTRKDTVGPWTHVRQ